MPGNFSAPVMPERLETLTIVPPGCIRRSASRLQRNAERSVLLNWRSHSSAVSSATGFWISQAALLTRVSRRTSEEKAASTWASSAASTPDLRLSPTTS